MIPHSRKTATTNRVLVECRSWRSSSGSNFGFCFCFGFGFSRCWFGQVSLNQINCGLAKLFHSFKGAFKRLCSFELAAGAKEEVKLFEGKRDTLRRNNQLAAAFNLIKRNLIRIPLTSSSSAVQIGSAELAPKSRIRTAALKRNKVGR